MIADFISNICCHPWWVSVIKSFEFIWDKKFFKTIYLLSSTFIGKLPILFSSIKLNVDKEEDIQS